jgi:hypothetical protein
MAEKNDKAPQAAPAASGVPAKPERRRYRMHDKAGKKIAGRIRPAGEFLFLDPAEAAKHPELTEVDAAGKPTATDKIAARETGSASGVQKRG